VVRANAIACGVAFIAAGIASVRTRRKAHFEPVYVTLGLLLLLGALLSGVFGGESSWAIWEIVLLLVAGAVLAAAYRLRRPLDFVLGVLAAYLGLLRLLAEIVGGGTTLAFMVAVSSLAVLAFLARAHRRLRETA
jgi:hypothetical protein